MRRARGTAFLTPRGGTGWACAVLAFGILGACDERSRPSRGTPPPPASVEPTVLTSELVAGTPDLPAAAPNPYVENAHVVAEGKRLFQWFNCAGCHGLQGGGGIGPPFADGRWIYGGEPLAIYQSIIQGRPEGMPAFRMLNADQVWKLVAYVRSLAPQREQGADASGTVPPIGTPPPGKNK